MRRLLPLIVVVCLALVAAPAAQAEKHHYKSCGNATVHGIFSSGISGFHVKRTSCKIAVRTMRKWLHSHLPKRVNGWRITTNQYNIAAFKGNARFRCYVFGTD